MIFTPQIKRATSNDLEFLSRQSTESVVCVDEPSILSVNTSLLNLSAVPLINSECQHFILEFEGGRKSQWCGVGDEESY